MPFIDLETISDKEIVPGAKARFVHSETMTMANWDIEKGASLPEHNHPHEQILIMIEGEFEFTVAGENHIMKPGKVFVLPTNIPHGGKALTPCRIIDVFHPVREDYR
jgi:quercetin dioxygenase-like cupin family protein